MVFKIARYLILCLLLVCNIFTFILPDKALAASEILTVSGEGNYTEGAYVGGAGTFDNLNSNDDDTSYLNVAGTLTSPLRHTYTFTNAVTTGIISNITLYYRVRYMSAGEPSVKIYTRNGGVDYYHSTVAITNSAYTTFSVTLNTNPATGLAWTTATINATEFGVEFLGTYRWTYAYIDVNYSQPSIPQVTTYLPTSIELTSAVFRGEVTNIGGAYIETRGFVWDVASFTNPGNVAPAASGYANNWTETNVWMTGSYTYPSAVLVADTTYYVRAAAYNGTYWSYGDEIVFNTIGTPSVQLLDATYKARVTARINASIVYDGAQPCEVQFGYDTITHAANFAAYPNIITVVGTFVTGDFVYLDLTGLNPGTTYFYNVAVTNDFITVYGTELTFDTPATDLVPPTDFHAKPEMNALNLSWTKGANATGTLIRYSLSTHPTTTTSGLLAYEGVDSSYRLLSLDSGRTHYLSAWSYSDGVFSATYTELMMTTLAYDVTIPSQDLPSPGNISKWLVNPSSANLQKLPGHQLVINVATEYLIPETSLWFIIGIISAIALAVFVWAFDNNHNQSAALIALSIGLSGGIAAGIYSGWMLAFVIAMGIGALVVALRM